MMPAKGKQLTRLAALYGVKRKWWEWDARLRRRVLGAMATMNAKAEARYRADPAAWVQATFYKPLDPVAQSDIVTPTK